MSAARILGSVGLLFSACVEQATPSSSSRALGEQAQTATLAIVGASVVHPGRAKKDAVERDVTVLVTGDRITSVGPAAAQAIPQGARVIEARGAWVIPGLVDTHVHFAQSGNPYTRPDIVDLTTIVPYAQEVARNKARLPTTFAAWLASGVTSVIDMGGPMWTFTVRDEAARSDAAPRVLVSGPLLSTVRNEPLELDDPPMLEVKTPERARAEARRVLARHPDFLKVWLINDPEKDDLAEQEAIVRAAGEEAHAAGVRLAVHATELAVAKAALRAGADLLVHSIRDRPVDDELIALARKNRASYTPTLFVTLGYRLALSGRWTPTETEKRLADPQILSQLQELARTSGSAKIEPDPVEMSNLRRVWDAGILVTMGTDAGNIGTVHGPSVFREMDLMAQAGLSPREVLLSATTNGAKVMGLERELGDVAPGMRADLVVLEADPLESVAALSRARFVLRAGRVFTPGKDELRKPVK